MRTRLALVLAILAVPHLARAGSQDTGLGVGVQSTLSGVVGPSVAYQADKFHIEGILAYHDDDAETVTALGARFYFHVHSTAMSDFGVGGGLTLVNVNPEGGDSNSDVDLELGAQIRAFVASNLALSAALGLAIITGDNDDINLTGDLEGTVGIHYYFY